MKKLSKRQLEKQLIILKSILNCFDFSKFYNVEFINIETLYFYIDFYNKTPFKIKEIIHSIDSYIPLDFLSDNNLIFNYKSALYSENIANFKIFKSIFEKNAIKNFLILIDNANCPNSFNNILNICVQFKNLV